MWLCMLKVPGRISYESQHGNAFLSAHSDTLAASSELLYAIAKSAD